ncbi:MAG TPA: polysaccharide deacetylase family protein [Chloroflexota bacterium]|nr:polysaccharide deacetylase family protein [Chloroflexota bacterium]
MTPLRRLQSVLLAAFLTLAAFYRPADATSARGVTPAVLSAGPAVRPAIALTFDDGPSPYTPAILALLRRYGAQATFFVIGRQVPEFRAIARAEIAAGDEIGDHTFTHPDLLALPNAGILFELQETQHEIEAATGRRAFWFRPPYGAIDARVAGLAASVGLQSITWSVDPRDWSRPGVSWIVTTVLANARPGSVVLFHDGGGDRSETVAALAQVLPDLRARGYHFVTLHQLFHPQALTRGRTAVSVTKGARRTGRSTRPARPPAASPTPTPGPTAAPPAYTWTCHVARSSAWWPHRLVFGCRRHRTI